MKRPPLNAFPMYSLLGAYYTKNAPGRHLVGLTTAPGCTETFMHKNAIPHILFHMCRQIGFALRATTNRGGLPSGFAAGMACRRFDLKVELQAIRLPFDIPAPSTFVKRRRAIPTFGSRQAPRHESGFARHEYPRMESQCPLLYSQPVALAIKYRDSHGRAASMMPP